MISCRFFYLQPFPSHFLPAKGRSWACRWVEQATVSRISQALTAEGFKCWMDIEGGMQVDLYDSMAVGVQNAAAIVACMSPAYQVTLTRAHACKTLLVFRTLSMCRRSRPPLSDPQPLSRVLKTANSVRHPVKLNIPP